MTEIYYTVLPNSNLCVKIRKEGLPFQLEAQPNSSHKEGCEKKSHSAINEAMTREHTIHIHQLIHGVGFKKSAPWTLKEIWKFAMMEMVPPDVHSDTRLYKAMWAEELRNVPYVSVCSCPENI